jgi:hypothetical protein
VPCWDQSGFLFHISGLLAQEFLSWMWFSSEKREVRQKFTFETIQNNTKARGHANFKALFGYLCPEQEYMVVVDTSLLGFSVSVCFDPGNAREQEACRLSNRL